MDRIIHLLALGFAMAILILALSAFRGMARQPLLGGLIGGIACLPGIGALALMYRR